MSNGGVLCSEKSGLCILRSKVCDGINDCSEAEDELNCPGGELSKVVCALLDFFVCSVRLQ